MSEEEHVLVSVIVCVFSIVLGAYLASVKLIPTWVVVVIGVAIVFIPMFGGSKPEDIKPPPEFRRSAKGPCRS